MKRKRTLNDPASAYQLAKAIVASAKIVEHDKFDRTHNFELLYAFLDAAGRVTGK